MKRLVVAMVLMASPAMAQGFGVGQETGLPLPRFESLRFNEVNLRRGAGADYPIAWTFVRRGLPVQVFQEYEDWRHVRDHDGATGWIKRTQLSPARYALVREEIAPLYSDANDVSRVVARAEPGVVLSIIACRIDWCKAKVSGYRGWVKKTGLWGLVGEDVFGEE